MIEAEEASEIVNQAAGQGVNIWLGTSIDENMKDEIRVTVVATGVRQDRVEKVVGHAPRQAVRYEQTSPSHAHNHNRHFDMAENCRNSKSSASPYRNFSNFSVW